DDALAALRRVCAAHPGRVSLFLHLLLASKEVEVRCHGVDVDASQELCAKIDSLLGAGTITVEYAGRAWLRGTAARAGEPDRAAPGRRGLAAGPRRGREARGASPATAPEDLREPDGLAADAARPAPQAPPHARLHQAPLRRLRRAPRRPALPRRPGDRRRPRALRGARRRRHRPPEGA